MKNLESSTVIATSEGEHIGFLHEALDIRRRDTRKYLLNHQRVSGKEISIQNVAVDDTSHHPHIGLELLLTGAALAL